MKQIILLLVLACYLTTVQGNCLKSDSSPKTAILSAESQHKFDYFFLEALSAKHSEKYTDAYHFLLHALSIDSTSSTAYYELSNYYLFLGRANLAIDALTKAVRFGNNNFDYKITLANLQKEVGSKEVAVAIYEELVKKYPNKPELNYYLSDLYTRQGKIDKAIEELDILEKNVGMNEALSIQKFRLYTAIQKKDQAFQEIEKLAAKYPSEAKYQIIMGDLYLEQKNPEKALFYYQQANQIDPGNPYYIASMANYYEFTQNKEAAEKEIDTALRNSKLEVETKLAILNKYIQTLQLGKKDLHVANVFFETLMNQYSQERELNLMYGQFLLAQDKTEEAKFQFQVVTEATPENIVAWKQLLGIALKENKMDDCIQLCNSALIHFPETSEFYFYKGAAYYQKKEYKEALNIYQQGIGKVEKEDKELLSDFYGQIGDLYFHSNEKEKAYIHYDTALVHNDKNIVVLNNYAYFLSVDKKELSKAERMSSQCIKIQPNNSTYIDTYAWILFVQGSYSLAKFYIEKAISIEGDKSGEIIEHYGDILFMNGDLENATLQWNKALEIKEKEGEDTTILKKKIADKKYYESPV